MSSTQENKVFPVATTMIQRSPLCTVVGVPVGVAKTKTSAHTIASNNSTVPDIPLTSRSRIPCIDVYRNARLEAFACIVETDMLPSAWKLPILSTRVLQASQ